ncbi:MAG: hypothetical protein CMD22_05255 [Flavobacteriales bacterium]|nr:hypothetical protein [Flavobacteriales bacterium]|tara:strand:- start:1178 stop:1600 length:423 start_codon:yes stop_codon:yes gene_type:complete
MKKHITILLFLIPQFCFSQIQSDSISERKKLTIEINMQEGIYELMERNQQINLLKEGVEGYCVQIYLGSSREKAQRMKYKFMKQFPKIKSVSYERVSPNWKVKVGKFRTKLEAEKLKNFIISEYPSCFITEVIVPIGEFD